MAGRPPSLDSCIAELAVEVQAAAREAAQSQLTVMRLSRELAVLVEQRTRPATEAASVA